MNFQMDCTEQQLTPYSVSALQLDCTWWQGQEDYDSEKRQKKVKWILSWLPGPLLLPATHPHVQRLCDKSHSHIWDAWPWFTKNPTEMAIAGKQGSPVLLWLLHCAAGINQNNSFEINWKYICVHTNKGSGPSDKYILVYFPYFSNSERDHLNQILHFKSCPFLKIKKTNP